MLAGSEPPRLPKSAATALIAQTRVATTKKILNFILITHFISAKYSIAIGYETPRNPLNRFSASSLSAPYPQHQPGTLLKRSQSWARLCAENIALYQVVRYAKTNGVWA
jgi:hypothetical protein